MAKFWELFAESVILQGVLSLMFGGTICYMYVTQIPVPQELVALLGIIIGFFFGGKVQIAAVKASKK
ncbi:MAG: hypothetical protein Q8J76_14205 [Desulfobulbaceae bacterium]|nr:hypothetical protein [Desulfobulbaceae bacterium]